MFKPIFSCLMIGILLSEASLADNKLEEIVVKSSPLHKNQSNMAQFTTVLKDDRLREQVARSLGETLSGELGVFSSSFGPNVGRPVIRGQGGERVRVLQDGVGALDISTISPDHALALEPVLAEQIEIIRGPNTLVYGSGAIGGVVNVIDGRIPEQLNEVPLTGAFEQRHSSVSDEDVSVLKLKGSSGGFAFYLDGLYRESNDIEIAGVALRKTGHSAIEEGHPEAHPKGYIENTSSQAKSGSLGFSWITDKSFIGVAVNHLENNYGIPPGAHEHQNELAVVEQEKVRIDLEQNRYELKGAWTKPFSIVEQLRLKVAYNDYQHTELEGNEIGTQFDNEGLEGRLEFTHGSWQGIHGVLGLHWQERKFSALGEEAFVPRSETNAKGLFLVQDFHLGDWGYEWGMRYEHQQSQAHGFQRRDHNLLSLSASTIWHLTETADISLVLSRAQRAPAIEELFSYGFHAATNTFEVGNPGLNKETAQSIELSFRQHTGLVIATISGYYNQIDDFIFERASGLLFDQGSGQIVPNCLSGSCLDVFRYSQQDAGFLGVEAEVKWQLMQYHQQPIEVRVFTDFVRAKLDQGGDLPRIPPWRYGVELRHQQNFWDIFLRTAITAVQNRPGDNEDKTDGFTDMSLGANFYYDQGKMRHTFFFKVTNLLNEEMRNAVSFLRDIAPQPGRSLDIGYRGEF